jgi:hypothetical protein
MSDGYFLPLVFHQRDGVARGDLVERPISERASGGRAVIFDQ